MASETPAKVPQPDSPTPTSSGPPSTPQPMASFAGVLSPRVQRQRARRSPWRLGIMLFLLVGVCGGLYAAGYRPQQLWETPVEAIPTVAVERGDVLSIVVESGALEGANNATVRCRVEAVMGTIGETQSGYGGGSSSGGRGGGRSGGTSSRSSGSSTGGGGGVVAKGKAAAVSATASAAAARTGTRSFAQKPTIKSFAYAISPHLPLRPALTSTLTSTASSGGGGGGGGRGGRGGFEMERQGSTRILSILEEGTRVEEGDLVCTLDDADFRDELAVQGIKVAEAKSWVDQAEAAYRVAQMEMKEYEDGVLPQDRALIAEYHQTCDLQLEQQVKDLAWEQQMAQQNLRAESQVRSARLAVERGQIALDDANAMLVQLNKYTAPKVLTELRAKLAAIETDLAAQKAAYVLEVQRQTRIEKAIKNCQLHAPRDGMVVYAKDSNGWGRVENQISEGVTVRENQAIFEIPDPDRMRIRVKVNESKVSLLKSGTPARIRVDSFPDRPLVGRITDVTVIPSPANGPFSDVKVYFALVDINDGFAGLRSGMSAKVEFLVETQVNVPRLPIDTIRWFDSTPFVAMLNSEGGHEWTTITVGLLDSYYAEIKGGLEVGDRVIADPSKLEPPSRTQRREAKDASWNAVALEDRDGNLVPPAPGRLVSGAHRPPV